MLPPGHTVEIVDGDPARRAATGRCATPSPVRRQLRRGRGCARRAAEPRGLAPAHVRRAARHVLQRRHRFEPHDRDRRASHAARHQHLLGGLPRGRLRRERLRAHGREGLRHASTTNCASTSASTPSCCRNLIWHHDLPLNFANSVHIYAVSKLARQHVTVVLTGEGADELFGGYPRYYIPRLAGVARCRRCAQPDRLLRHAPDHRLRKLGALRDQSTDDVLLYNCTGVDPRTRACCCASRPTCHSSFARPASRAARTRARRGHRAGDSSISRPTWSRSSIARTR